MVANLMDKAVNKSYVRLPGSGSDKEAGISFCDLSRGSNLAASIPVPQHVGMPRNVSSKGKPTTHSCDSSLAASTPVPQHANMPRQASSSVSSTTHKRPRNEDDTNVQNKRCHIDSTNQNVARAPSDVAFKPVSVTSPVPASHLEIGSNSTPTINNASNEPVKDNQKTTKVIIISNTSHDMTKLKEENSQLRSENAILKKQITLFKQLFRNPQRYESFFQRLNERAAIKPVPAA